MSFKHTYNKHYKELYRFARQHVQDVLDVEDLVQETFLRYHAAIKKGVKLENVRAWLYKVLLNQIKTQDKKKNLRQEKLMTYPTIDQRLTDANEAFNHKEKKAIVFGLLDLLTERERNLLLLYNNELKYHEIAEILDIKPGSVGTLLARAMEKIKALVKENYHELYR